MSLENLSGTELELVDKNLLVHTPNDNPVVLVMGTAEKGPSEAFIRVARLTDASKAFGKSGTLIRGMYEVAQGGATNIRLYRFGATAATLVIPLGVAGADVTFTTVAKDDSTGGDFNLLYVGSTGITTIRRVLDSVIILQIDPADPSVKIDLNEVALDGVIATGNTDVDDGAVIAVAVALEDVATTGDSGSAYAGATFTAGTDGVEPSRMELWQGMHTGFGLLRDQIFDHVLVMDTYVDDKNVQDETGNTVSGLWFGDVTNTYPTAGTTKDILGKVYTEEFEGENQYWWLLHWDRTETDATPGADISTLTAPVVLFPSGVSSATASTKTDGTALSFDDFHEVNFGYDLGNFCFTVSEEENVCIGAVGMLGPISLSLKDVANWVGKLPVVDADTDVITTNGTGLLGNKWLNGRLTSGSGMTKLPGHVINGVDGKFNGGFIQTDSGFVDGAQQKDSNDSIVDLGKYLSVVSAQPLLSNPVLTSYRASGMGVYSGFVSTLDAASAPTNKIVPGVGLPFRINITKVDTLAGQRYVHFHEKAKGVVVSDAPTAARPESDYNRLSTVRIVKASVDAVRAVADPFLGEGLSGATMMALETAIERVLVALQQAGMLRRFDRKVSATQDQQVLGEATVELTLVPAFELRKITVVVNLAKQ